MKVIVGLFLIATALALPVPEEENKPGVPLVNAASTLSKSEEIKPAPQDSPESSSEESSEKPSEEIKATTLPSLKREASEEVKSSEESVESKPLQDEAPAASQEDPKTTAAPKVEEATTVAAKPAEAAPSASEPKAVEVKKDEPATAATLPADLPAGEAKKVLPSLPTVKLISESGASDVVQAAKEDVAVAEESKPAPVPVAKSESAETPVATTSIEATTEKIEKPLALPAVVAEEKKGSEIKEEIVLPSEIKSTIAPIPPLGGDERPSAPVSDEKIAAGSEIEEKREAVDDKKKAKAEGDAPDVSAEPPEVSAKPTEAPAKIAGASAKPAELVAKPSEAPAAVSEVPLLPAAPAKEPESLAEKLPEPSASS